MVIQKIAGYMSIVYVSRNGLEENRQMVKSGKLPQKKQLDRQVNQNTEAVISELRLVFFDMPMCK